MKSTKMSHLPERTDTVIAIAAGLRSCTASEKSIKPASCFPDQSKRSFRPSVPSLESIRALAIYGTYNRRMIVTMQDHGKELETIREIERERRNHFV